ncbi:hypothetical protein AALB16_14655 [Lachnospiraceae bacterium 62-35]
MKENSAVLPQGEEKSCPLGEELLAKIQVKWIPKVLVGLGEEWDGEKRPDMGKAYEALADLLEGKDYFIITTNMDGIIFQSRLKADRITAPCGNIHWFQCKRSCTKDIWEEGEIPEGICPHCGAPLIPNTVKAEKYIEEGYLPQWLAYRKWLAGTLNRDVTVLELGVGFSFPGLIRWPFEKLVFCNEKARMCRVHESFYQLSKEIKEKGRGIPGNSVEYIKNSPIL